jgi:two-component system LytT family response regulator
MKLQALIADDEPLARERLRFLLAAEEEIEIAGECRNGKEVVAALKERPYDVLFLDIQMQGGNGFAAIEELGLARMTVTVFVTGQKPVDRERLKATLERVKEKITSQNAVAAQEQFKLLLSALRDGVREKKEYLKRIVVPNGTKDSVVNVDDIEWIEAADYYSCLHVGSKSLMLRETIKQLAETLDPGKFVRVHRSAIVNLGQVREILRGGRSEGWVLLANGRRLKMSKVGWEALLAATRSAS